MKNKSQAKPKVKNEKQKWKVRNKSEKREPSKS
jgi:hypothetical protein